MNQFFYHFILKNNFENFEKHLTKKDGKNLITCKASLFLEKIVSKLKNDTPKLLCIDPDAMEKITNFSINPQITYFKPTFRRHQFFSFPDFADTNFASHPKNHCVQDKFTELPFNVAKSKKMKSRKNRKFAKSKRSSKNRNKKKK